MAGKPSKKAAKKVAKKATKKAAKKAANKDGKEVDLTSGYAKTRKSLIARLENWEDQLEAKRIYKLEVRRKNVKIGRNSLVMLPITKT